MENKYIINQYTGIIFDKDNPKKEFKPDNAIEALLICAELNELHKKRGG